MSKSKSRSGKSAKPAKAKSSPRKPRVKSVTPKTGAKSTRKLKSKPRPSVDIPSIPEPAAFIPPAKPIDLPPIAEKDKTAPIPEKPAAIFKATQPLPAEVPASPPPEGATAGKPAPVTVPYKIPAILLEGDEPTPRQIPQSSATTPTPSQRTSEVYGSGRLTATPRDPHCLYVHWDFTYEQQQQFNAASVHGAMVLRVRSERAKDLPEVHLHKDSRHWFLHVPHANAAYRTELGYYQKNGGWVRVAESDDVRTPPDQVAQDKAFRFARMPEARPASREGSTEGQAAGTAQHWKPQSITPDSERHGPLHTFIPPGVSAAVELLPAALASPTEWTSAQEEALDDLVGDWLTQPEWFESGQVSELVQGRTQRNRRTVEQGFTFPAPSSAEIALAALAPEQRESISSPVPGPEQQRSFWFNVNTELIVYGATDPSATVKIGNRPIRLRRDGTFSYRFALPDGYYELPAVATSFDGESRRAHLRFARASQYQSDVGQHPQDQGLKVPAPENTE